MYLTLERKGTFKASSMINTATKCGAMAMTEYTYKVKIQASSKRLTPEGYVLNNEDVQNFFDARFGEKAKPWLAFSCENMVRESCEGLALLCRSKRIRIKRLEVTLTGSNGALITAEWEPKLYTPILGVFKNPFAMIKWKPQEALQESNLKHDAEQAEIDEFGGDL